jgi:hypothetical protein
MVAITVSANDVANYTLQTYITNLGTQITAANTAGNYPLAAQLTQLQVAAQQALVASLMACGSISAATILTGAGATYSLPPWLASNRAPVN